MMGLMFLNVFLAVIFARNISKNIGYSLLITTVSLTINYILYIIATGISYMLANYLKNDYFIFVIILSLYSILVKTISKIKRFKKGINFLKKNETDEYLGMLILNISSSLFFSFIIISNLNMNTIKSLFVYIVIFSIIMFITIQKSLQLYYKQKLQEREVSEIKDELENKEKEIKELEKENLNLNKINHSLSHKIKSIKYELNQTTIKTQTKKELKDKIDKIAKQMQDKTIKVELNKTNVEEIDNMLEYMQSECINNKIDFQLQINGNIHHMINKYIEKEDLEILIADHVKNAIIAINHSKNINKSILVRIGIIEGFYSLYIYDSGIEFEIETLINLGNKPSTTHKDDGGTGMGFMNTFDTLRKYHASIVICEYGEPSEERFTKLIKIIFDNKEKYKIFSYRDKEISERDIQNRLDISKEETYS